MSRPPNFQEAMVNKLLSLASLSVQYNQASDKDLYTLIARTVTIPDDLLRRIIVRIGEIYEHCTVGL